MKNNIVPLGILVVSVIHFIIIVGLLHYERYINATGGEQAALAFAYCIILAGTILAAIKILNIKP